jgi:flagellar hook protein FlgE
MMQALSSAVAGLDGEQTAMNVIGNNIANVNTIGFKSSSVDFTTLLSQLLSSGSAPVITAGKPTLGGTNPQAVGLGVGIGSITQNMAQGSLQQTGNPLDVAIQGNGFLVLTGTQGTVYSRDGGLEIDAQGDLVQASTGSLVEGFQPTPPPTPGSPWAVPAGNLIPPTGTAWTPTYPAAGSTTGLAPINIPQQVTSGGTTYDLASVAIGSNGQITGTYQGTASGGSVSSIQVLIGQIPVATFPNENGLIPVAGNAFTAGPNAGTFSLVGPGTSGGGSFAVGSLEQSNVDISQELTNMIVAERSYQVDAKVITTADDMLQSLIQVQ